MYEIFDGDSKARTMHWLHNLKVLGHIDSEVQADVPSYNVFVNSNNDTTYITYNLTPFYEKSNIQMDFPFLMYQRKKPWLLIDPCRLIPLVNQPLYQSLNH